MNPTSLCPHVNTETALNDVLKTKDKLIALIYANWCPFCIRFLPPFEREAEKAPQYFIVVQDDQEILATKYSVNVIPTVLFFEHGQIRKRLDGTLGIGLSEKKLAEFIRDCI